MILELKGSPRISCTYQSLNSLPPSLVQPRVLTSSARQDTPFPPKDENQQSATEQIF